MGCNLKLEHKSLEGRAEGLSIHDLLECSKGLRFGTYNQELEVLLVPITEAARTQPSKKLLGFKGLGFRDLC